MSRCPGVIIMGSYIYPTNFSELNGFAIDSVEARLRKNRIVSGKAGLMMKLIG